MFPPPQPPHHRSSGQPPATPRRLPNLTPSRVLCVPLIHLDIPLFIRHRLLHTLQFAHCREPAHPSLPQRPILVTGIGRDQSEAGRHARKALVVIDQENPHRPGYEDDVGHGELRAVEEGSRGGHLFDEGEDMSHELLARGSERVGLFGRVLQKPVERRHDARRDVVHPELRAGFFVGIGWVYRG